jgi:antitoxin ParD1/3/4
MNISLTQELEGYINQKVASGNYHSASEVVREGLRLLQEQDELKKIRREALRREIMLGVEAVREGRYTVVRDAAEMEQFMEDIKRDGMRKRAEKEEDS